MPIADSPVRRFFPSIVKTVATAGILAATLAFASPAPAQELLTQAQIKQIQHYLECLDWLANNPARHRRFCEPSMVPPAFGTLAVLGFGVAPSLTAPEEDDDCEGRKKKKKKYCGDGEGEGGGYYHHKKKHHSYGPPPSFGGYGKFPKWGGGGG